MPRARPYLDDLGYGAAVGRLSGSPIAGLALAVIAAGIAPSARAERAEAPSSPPPTTTQLRVTPRPPLAIVTHSPTGAAGETDLGTLVARFAERVDALTAFHPMERRDAKIKGCGGRVGCIVHSIQAGSGSDDGEPGIRYVLLLTQIAIPSRPDRIVASLVDVERALEALEGRAPEDAEERILRYAVVADWATEEVDSDDDLGQLAEVFFRSRVAPVLAPRGEWRPYSQAVLHGLPLGAELRVDGHPVGQTDHPTVVLSDLPRGQHEVMVIHPDFAPYRRSIDVGGSEQAVYDVALRRAPRGVRSRDVLFWSGVASAAAGAALLAVAAAEDDRGTTYCFEGADCAPGTRFNSFSGPPESGIGSAPSDGGVLVAPLGISLVSAGVVWSVGARLEGERRVPWISLLAGLAVGGAAYGVSAAVSD